jgi:integrase
MTALMARTGLKVGQVLAMQRRHYEPGAHVVTVPAGGKNAAERTVPVDAVTGNCLRRGCRFAAT